MEKRVVITGLGTVNSLGNNPSEFFNNLLQNKHGITKITKFDYSDLKVSLASEVKNFDPTKLIAPKDIKRFDLVSVYAVYVAKQAHIDAGLDKFKFDPYKYATILSTAAGGLGTYEIEFIKAIKKGTFSKVHPMLLPKVLPNMPSGNVAIEIGSKGSNLCIITACASGTHSIGEAWHIIKRGDANLVMAGSSEASIYSIGIAGFSNLRALSTSQNPNRASIPFDKERDGFVMGEGAGALVLEELEHALTRGAKIYGEIIGYGSTCDANHMTKPTIEGPTRCIQQALNSANLQPKEIDYINAHGTSTPVNDENETLAIKNVFGENTKIKISSTKSAIGHTLGAAGAIEALVCSLALKTGQVPGTVNSNGDGKNCDLDYMINGSEKLNPQYIISNSFGFGGHNATLVFKKWEGK